MVSLEDGQMLLQMVGQKAMIGPATPEEILSEAYSNYLLAPFSSLGPTSDGRIKPDLIAPGHYIYSARSYGTASRQHRCDKDDLIPMKGFELVFDP